jgi:hypothetical protein
VFGTSHTGSAGRGYWGCGQASSLRSSASSGAQGRRPRPSLRPLVRASAGLLVLLAAHASEHVLRVPGGPGAIPGQLWVAVALLFALVGGSLVLSARGDQRGPRLAIWAGAACVVAPLGGHLVPVHTAVSQPFWDEQVDALSWSLVLAIAGGGIWLAMAGMRVVGATSTARYGRLLAARSDGRGGHARGATESGKSKTDPWKRMSESDAR